MIAVHSTWGDLAVVEFTGFVVKADSVYFEKCDEEQYDACVPGDIGRIVRFDVGEFRHFWRHEIPQSVDILDIGYWTEDGHYEPPCAEWRDAYKSDREGVTT